MNIFYSMWWENIVCFNLFVKICKKMQFVLCELHFLCYTVMDIIMGAFALLVNVSVFPVNQFLFFII